MRNRLSRLPLLWKIVLVTSLAVTVLLGVSGWIVQRYAVHTTSQALQDELRTSLRAYEALWESRAQMLASVSLILSNMSDVRAAFSTGDQATIRDTAGELWSKISTDDATFFVTDPQGRVLASLGGAAPIRELPIVTAASPKFPKQSVGFMSQGNRLYQAVVTPVYVDAQHGAALLNVLVAGYPVSKALAERLKASTGSDFVFWSDQHVIASTENLTNQVAPQPAEALSSEPRMLSVDGTEYASVSTPLLDIEGRHVGELRIVRSFALARQRLVELQRKLLGIWAMAVVVALILSYILARRIVSPIKRLDRAVAEVAHCNYDSRVPVEGQDELGRLAASFNDMCASIQEAREELIRQERLSTIGHLSTSIVHDLRNPLAAIYGGAEMLVDGDLPPPQIKRLANNIYRGSRRIQELLQDLVDASRRGTESAELCWLRDVVHAACDPLLPAAQAQGVALEFEIPEDIELPLARARIERVFFNLCSNSLEAMPGHGRIQISAQQTGNDVLVRVSDTGPGVEGEVRRRLFQPFVTTGKKNGLGLGLALSRQTVISHGGDLWAESVESGACFCLRLPLARGSLGNNQNSAGERAPTKATQMNG